MPTQNFKATHKVTTETQFGEALEQLDRKIDQLQKSISYLDLYSISTAVEQEDELASAISLLAPGEALVINIPYTFVSGDREYHTGDIILRLLDNKEIHIKANVGGVYYPQKLEKVGSNFKLSYGYLNSQPSDGIASITTSGNTQTVSTPKKNINFTIDNNTENATIYGLFELLTSSNLNSIHYSFAAVGPDSNKIRPVIKFYAVDDNVILEEVNVSYSLELNNQNQWEVSIKDGFYGWPLYIMVK